MTRTEVLASDPGLDAKSESSDRSIYGENPLISACGPILTDAEVMPRLLQAPPPPDASEPHAAHLVLHELNDLWRIHIPTETGVALAQGIDTMIRQGYVHRDPRKPLTWQRIYQRGGDQDPPAEPPIQLAASVFGVSGAGKTSALEAALRLKPQVVTHDRFPHLAGPVRQLVWLKADAPGSGNVKDLVDALARASDLALGTDHAGALFKGRSRTGAMLANEWLARIACHFPGVIVLDEIQNLFKIEAKAIRRSAEMTKGRPLLRIVDDEALKFILTLTNTTKIPIVICGTPDAMRVFGTRTSTAQRLVTAGFYQIDYAASPDDEFFRKRLLPVLFKYQWLNRRLHLTTELCTRIHKLTAGVPRICVALWFHAHRRALRLKAQGLEPEHLEHAALNELAPLRAAIQALLSQDPRRLAQFEDLIPPDASW